MTMKWVGLILLLAALVVGDQIRLHRPGHKYRLSVSVETPDGLKSASGVFAVFPYRGYSVSGDTYTCEGEFDMPVTFTDDEWRAELQGNTNHLFAVSGSIPLEELKDPL